MSINIFEGARRIALVFLVLVAAFGVFLAFDGSQEEFWNTLLKTPLVMACFYVLFRVIGWIVRGFLGIAKGHDHR